MIPADQFYTALPGMLPMGSTAVLVEVQRADEKRKQMEEMVKEKDREVEGRKKSQRECLTKLDALKITVDGNVKREQEALSKVDEIKTATTSLMNTLDDLTRQTNSSEARRHGILSKVERAARETKEAQERERQAREELLKEESSLQILRSKVINIRQDASQRQRWQDTAEIELERAKAEVAKSILLHSEQLKNLQEAENEATKTEQDRERCSQDLDEVKRSQAVIRMNLIGSQKHDVKQLTDSVLSSCTAARSGIAGIAIGTHKERAEEILNNSRLDSSLLELKADSTEQMRRIAADRLDTLRRTIDFTYSYEPSSAIPIPTAVPAAAQHKVLSLG